MGLRTITVNTDPMEDEVCDEHMTGQAPDYDRRRQHGYDKR